MKRSQGYLNFNTFGAFHATTPQGLQLKWDQDVKWMEEDAETDIPARMRVQFKKPRAPDTNRVAMGHNNPMPGETIQFMLAKNQFICTATIESLEQFPEKRNTGVYILTDLHIGDRAIDPSVYASKSKFRLNSMSAVL